MESNADVKSLIELGIARPIVLSGSESSIIQRVARLLSTPLSAFEPDDLRFMTIQGRYLNQMVPLAIGALEGDVLLEASYYRGDLLKSVLAVPKSHWEEQPEQLNALRQIIARSLSEQALSSLSADIATELRQLLATLPPDADL